MRAFLPESLLRFIAGLLVLLALGPPSALAQSRTTDKYHAGLRFTVDGREVQLVLQPDGQIAAIAKEDRNVQIGPFTGNVIKDERTGQLELAPIEGAVLVGKIKLKGLQEIDKIMFVKDNKTVDISRMVLHSKQGIPFNKLNKGEKSCSQKYETPRKDSNWQRGECSS